MLRSSADLLGTLGINNRYLIPVKDYYMTSFLQIFGLQCDIAAIHSLSDLQLIKFKYHTAKFERTMMLLLAHSNASKEFNIKEKGASLKKRAETV